MHRVGCDEKHCRPASHTHAFAIGNTKFFSRFQQHQPHSEYQTQHNMNLFSATVRVCNRTAKIMFMSLYITKEPHIHHKRALYTSQKSLLYITKEPHIHHKRALGTQKKTIHIMNEPHKFVYVCIFMYTRRMIESS